MLEAVTYANGAKATAEYDLNGRLVAETDPEGAETRYAYDPVGRVTAVTDALGATTRYAYDAADNLTAIMDALGNETRYEYDGNGNLTRETDALGNTVSYTYTPEGWLSTITDAEGKVTRFQYDKTGNILTEDYAGELYRENTYNEIGLLTAVTSEEGVTGYQYDDASRLVSIKQPNGEIVSYTYDGYGNRLTMTYPNGKTVKYTYDDMNRLVAVKGVDGATTKYSYDALGRRIATDGAKEDTTYAYDEMGNLVSQTTTGAYDLALEYAYDLSGRMTKESRTENGTTLESSFVYDALGQLTEFTRSDNISESYTYDPVGNMLTKTANGVKTQYTYNAANQLISDGENRYSYDKNGNLTQKGDVRYTYNALNLLQSWTDGEGTESYRYNADGLLSTIQNNEGTTALTWDILMGDGVVISANTNGVETNYSYGLERISAQTGRSKTEYIYDGRGSVAAEVSYSNAWYTLGGTLSKKEVVSKSYTPFGEQIGEAVSGFGYNGEYYNVATGQIYLRARFYEPAMNRFSQKDVIRGSIADPGSLNRYSYVQNDPVNFIDPSGQSLKSFVSRTVNKVSSAAKSVVSKAKTAVSSAYRSASSAGKAAQAAAKASPNRAATAKAASAASMAYMYANDARMTGSGVAAKKAEQAARQAYTYANEARMSSNSSVSGCGGYTGYYNASYNPGKIPSPDAPRIEDVVDHALELCKDFGKKAVQVSAEIYVEYTSFKNGMSAAVIRNLGQPGTNLFGALESLITGKATLANKMQSSLNTKIHSYEENSYDKTMFSIGKVAGDIGEIAADILLAIYSGGATAGMKVAAKSGNALVLVSDVVAAGSLVEAGAIADAVKNGTNLGNDLSELINQIKGNGEAIGAGKNVSNNSINEDKAGNNRLLSKKEIKDLGGEKTTSILKEAYGGSKSDLRIDKAGNVYVVRKGNIYGEFIGTLEELIMQYGG